MIRRPHLAALAVAVLVAGTGCKTTDVVKRHPNPGSHHVSWVANSLLPGRTVIQFESWTRDWTHWRVTRAVYHARDGMTLSCEGQDGRYRAVRFDGSYFTWDGDGKPAVTAATGNHEGYRAPVFFNVRTGRFHTEAWDERDGGWEIEDDGWIQEGWPRVMADACPGITQEILADGGWINEKQTQATIYLMLEEDPQAPLVLAYMTPERPTGIAAARPVNSPFLWCFETRNRPVLPPHCLLDDEEQQGPTLALLFPESPDEAADYRHRFALADTLEAAHGHILEDRLGRAYVLALHPEADELWSIDADGQVLDVGYLAWNAAEGRLELDWETLPETMDYHLRPGEALPVVNTGRRHPLFAMTDWLTGRAADVTLPYFGRQALFRFGEDGSLVARAAGDRDIPGSWAVSRGSLVLTLEGVADKAAYAWQPLARHLGDHAGWSAG